MEEGEGLGFGSSLPVPSVQEIVRKDAHIVPPRYIRSIDDRPKASDTSSSISDQIPVIDLSLLARGDEEEQNKLDAACQDWGFFQGSSLKQIVNHGADEVVAKMKRATAEFFELPLSEKMKYAMSENDLHGYGQANVISEDQKLDWNDILVLMTLPHSVRCMKYWPLSIPGFKEAVEDYVAVIMRVTNQILTNISLLMGMEKDFLRQMHGDMKQGIRMNYYPRCCRPDVVLGVSPHSDGGSLNLLVQDDDITGLQIKHDGVWVPVTPISNAIVVNVGDALEAWSNGKYKSIEHRAVTNVDRPRISAAAFVGPAGDVELNPLETMVDDEVRPRIFRNGVKHMDYLKYIFSKKMDGKSANIEYLKLKS